MIVTFQKNQVGKLQSLQGCKNAPKANTYLELPLALTYKSTPHMPHLHPKYRLMTLHLYVLNCGTGRFFSL